MKGDLVTHSQLVLLEIYGKTEYAWGWEALLVHALDYYIASLPCCRKCIREARTIVSIAVHAAEITETSSEASGGNISGADEGRANSHIALFRMVDNDTVGVNETVGVNMDWVNSRSDEEEDSESSTSSNEDTSDGVRGMYS